MMMLPFPPCSEVRSSHSDAWNGPDPSCSSADKLSQRSSSVQVVHSWIRRFYPPTGKKTVKSGYCVQVYVRVCKVETNMMQMKGWPQHELPAVNWKRTQRVGARSGWQILGRWRDCGSIPSESGAHTHTKYEDNSEEFISGFQYYIMLKGKKTHQKTLDIRHNIVISL